MLNLIEIIMLKNLYLNYIYFVPKKLICFSFFLLSLSCNINANEKILMKTLNEYTDFMVGPGAPEIFRNGFMNLGSIHSLCYDKKTVNECSDVHRKAGSDRAVEFLVSFEEYLPKLKKLKKMKEDIESSRVNPYEPTSHALYLYRNCSLEMECFVKARRYFDALFTIRKECPLVYRSNKAQITAGKMWICFDPINIINSEAKILKPDLSSTSKAAMHELKSSKLKSTLDLLNKDNIFDYCKNGSEFVDENICHAAMQLRGFFDLVEESIWTRGVSKDGEIDFSRDKLYEITNDRKVLQSKSEPDKYKGYSTVKFNKIKESLDQDGVSMKKFYLDRSEQISAKIEAKKQAEQHQYEFEKEVSTVYENFLDRLKKDNAVMHDGTVGDILKWLQNGLISVNDVSDYVISTEGSKLKLDNISGSMLIFSAHANQSYQVALHEKDAKQVVANGNLSSVCGCHFIRLISTKSIRDDDAGLIQSFEILPYKNKEIDAIVNIRKRPKL